jgi:hypothetical protein
MNGEGGPEGQGIIGIQGKQKNNSGGADAIITSDKVIRGMMGSGQN